ncbi:MAG: DNA repair exonuclease [Candidatus Methanomethylophilaceae archaeon]|nr:DNA repair exonuclease [Candidatus Methanomethylophilaceae archaeon]
MGGSFRFIHCADLHLGSRFVGIASLDSEKGRRMKESTFTALKNIVKKAKQENVDFVIFSGDIFDDSNETPLTRANFADALRELSIPCYIAYGNHDYARRWADSIPLPDNALVFPDEAVCFHYPSEEDCIARIYGVSHSVRHVSRDLTEGIKGEDGVFCLAAVHCDVDPPAGSEDAYAPCSLRSLLNKGIDYWALGHIHKRGVLNEYPHVVYPGNTQGRDVSENGRKGAYLVTVRDGRVSDMSFFQTGDIVWETIEMDITGRNDVNSLISELIPLAQNNMFIRLILKGHGPLDRILRLEKHGFKELVEARTGCECADLVVNTLPEIDMEKKRNAGDFMSAIIEYGDRVSHMRREDLVKAVCSNCASDKVRDIFDKMSTDELQNLVNDAVLMIIEKSMEGAR